MFKFDFDLEEEELDESLDTSQPTPNGGDSEATRVGSETPNPELHIPTKKSIEHDIARLVRSF